MTDEPAPQRADVPIEEIIEATVRFAGDSGDGMQLAGTRFADAAAAGGQDLSTFPDFPAEIRAPVGTLPGVSAFQIHFSSRDIHTPGDVLDCLVALNPAALKVHLRDLGEGGILIVDEDTFNATNLHKANYTTSPLHDGSLAGYRLIPMPITTLTRNSLDDLGMSLKDVDRSRNLFTLGVVYWLYDRDLVQTKAWITRKFSKHPLVVEANIKALQAGFNYANTIELFTSHYRVGVAPVAPGTYRQIQGNEATALGFLAASVITGKELVYASYPITPASDILHSLSRFKSFGVKTFQAEDEIAAICAAIGAAFGGSLALTATSGPGLALKSEGLGLAVIVELPLVVAMVQRAGPSTGMPTKTEQADLLQVLFGRNGESPVIVVAPATPSDCFWMAVEAFRLATKYVTPVVFLSDGYLANGVEPWRLPTEDELPKFHINHPEPDSDEPFLPYSRDPVTNARPWTIAGTPGLEHRIGGLEKEHLTGNVSYDPDNHQVMTRQRQLKIERVCADVPPTELIGEATGRVLLLGWGSSYGAIRSATELLQAEGVSVSHAHLRYLNPLPPDLGGILDRFEKVIIPEMNLGQLAMLIRSRYLIDAIPLNKVTGQPFKVAEIASKVREVLA